ncbi:hypothetical protein [Actinocorallia aurantiaca]|uniref:Uncharacterized protein n=1 Tax=Actinocorallia aurantiaca TaxID=46204 RepID=A0ABN3UK17_9ACTN
MSSDRLASVSGGEAEPSLGGPQADGEPQTDEEEKRPLLPRDPQGKPEYELIDLETMPAANPEPVVQKARAPEGRNQRTFLLIMIIGIVLTTTVGVSWLGAAFMEPERWAQLQPEVKEVRTWVFFTAGPIIGYFFAHRDNGG